MGLLSTALQVGSSVAGKFLSRAGTKVAARYGVGVAGVGLATAAGTAIGNRMQGGGQVYDMGPVRRKRKGLSGRDIQGAQRVMQLVSSFGYKPKLPCRRKGRKCGR
jgi:hypothetical protein